MKINLFKLGIIFSAIIVLGFSNSAKAAVLSAGTLQDTYAIGDQFNADIKIDSQDVGVNAAQATIKFSPAILQVISVDKTNSVFNFWIQEPAFDNKTGEITFIGGASSGLVGKSLQVVRVVFKAAGIGQSDLVFSDGAVTASDGSGTNVLSAMNKSSITVTNSAATAKGTPPIQTIERTPVPANTAPAKPAVTVPLYPDPTKWYNVSSKFNASWTLPNDVSAVATDLDKNPAFDPPTSQGVFNNQNFSALPDGISYLNVRFYNSLGWSDTNHYRIAIDTVPPVPFDIKFSDGQSSDNPIPTITYQANDQLSGIDHYYIQTDSGAQVTTTSKSYTLPPQKPGKHTIKVGAQDKAGNKVENTAQFEIIPIQSPVIVSVSTTVYSGEGGLLANGTATPNVSIILEVRDQKNNVIYSFTTNADEKGKWAIKIDSPLKDGNYNIFATAQDSRGATSLPVKSDLINVTDRPIFIIFGFGITATYIIIILIIILIGGYAAGWYTNRLLNLQIERKIVVSQRDVSASFGVIKTDVTKALKSWSDGVVDSREVGEIEFLLKHANETLDKLEKYIISGIKDIGNKK